MRRIDQHGDDYLAWWLETDQALIEGATPALLQLMQQVEAGEQITLFNVPDTFTDSPHVPLDVLVWLGKDGPVVTVRFYSDEDPETMFSIVRIAPDDGELPIIWRE